MAPLWRMDRPALARPSPCQVQPWPCNLSASTTRQSYSDHASWLYQKQHLRMARAGRYWKGALDRETQYMQVLRARVGPPGNRALCQEPSHRWELSKIYVMASRLVDAEVSSGRCRNKVVILDISGFREMFSVIPDGLQTIVFGGRCSSSCKLGNTCTGRWRLPMLSCTTRASETYLIYPWHQQTSPSLSSSRVMCFLDSLGEPCVRCSSTCAC